MKAVIGALRAVLGMDTQAFEKGVGVARKELSTLNRSFQASAKQMNSVGQSMSVAVTAPLLALKAVTLRAAGNFEESMNRVQAATQATREEFGKMVEMARKIGPAAGFTATEAAASMEALAKNGLTVTQILEGAAKATVDLAAANGAQLAPAADVVTDVMNNFGKTAAELPGVVDTITGTLIASKFGFDDYKLAIGQAAGVAGKVGVTFEDFNAALAATSSSFASGSDAGTSFKTFLTKLAPTSKEAKEAMDSLKLEFFDSTGAMLSMGKIAGNLQKAFGGLSDQARVTSATKIFGTDSMRTALALATAGAEGIAKMRVEITKMSAADQAAVRLKGFNGAVKSLGAAFEGLQIAIGNSGLLADATAFTQALTKMVIKVSELNPELLKTGTIIGGIAIALGPAIYALGFLTSGFGKVIVMLGRLVPAFAPLIALVAPWVAIAAAVTATAVAVALLSDKIPISVDGAVTLADVWNAAARALANYNAEQKKQAEAPNIEPGYEGFDSVGAMAMGEGITFGDLARKVAAGLDMVAGIIAGAMAAIRVSWETSWASLRDLASTALGTMRDKVYGWAQGIVDVLNWLRDKIGKEPLTLPPIEPWKNESAGAFQNAGKVMADAWNKGFQQTFFSDSVKAAIAAARDQALLREMGKQQNPFPESGTPSIPVPGKTAPPPGGGKGGAGLPGGGGESERDKALKKLKEFIAEQTRAVELEKLSAEQREISEAIYKAEALAKEAQIKLTKDDTDAITANVLALRAAKVETEERSRMESLAKSTIEDTMTAQEKYNRLIADLTTLYNAGAISQDQFVKAQALAVEQMRGGKGEWSTQWAEFADAVSGVARSVAADMFNMDQDIGTVLANLVKRIAQFAFEILVLQPLFDAVGKMIKSSLSTSGSGGGGIGDLISLGLSALSMYFGGSAAGTGAGGSMDASYGGGMSYGGPRAGGGSVSPGKWYEVNELGQERFIPEVPGRIVPHDEVAEMGRGGDTYMTANIHPDVRQTARAQVMDMMPMIRKEAAKHVMGLRQRGGPMKSAFAR